MAVGIYAGASIGSMTLLPSPTEVTPTNELVWSEDTGRAQSGYEKAKMIGSVVAEKRTYVVKWGVITEAEMNSIKSMLPKNFFYFGVGTSQASAQANAGRFYRSTITGNMLPIGNTLYYKDVSVSVIEQ